MENWIICGNAARCFAGKLDEKRPMEHDSIGIFLFSVKMSGKHVERTAQKLILSSLCDKIILVYLWVGGTMPKWYTDDERIIGLRGIARQADKGSQWFAGA